MQSYNLHGSNKTILNNNYCVQHFLTTVLHSTVSLCCSLGGIVYVSEQHRSSYSEDLPQHI